MNKPGMTPHSIRSNKSRPLFLLALLSTILLLSNCELLEEPPENHSVDFGGVWHMPGYESPSENCTQCHGEFLGGGTSGVACYDCHDKLP